MLTKSSWLIATLSLNIMAGMANAVVVSLLGFFLRFSLMRTTVGKLISNRIEVSTPLNAWKRVTEGVYLHRINISPYDGDIFHEPPIFLYFYDRLRLTESSTRSLVVPLCFTICDVITAVLLACAAKKAMAVMVKEEQEMVKAQSAEHLSLTPEAVAEVPQLVMTVYLLSPYSILNCAGMATTVFSNLLVAMATVSTVHGWWFPMAAVLAVETYKSFYPVMLLVPSLLYMVNTRKRSIQKWPEITTFISMTVLVFASVLVALLYASFLLSGSWKFFSSTYGFIWSVPDLTPNIGLFWYFFTEVFEHFRVFFLWIFQLNAFVYLLPLAICLRKDPILLFLVVLALMTVFKSYPSVGDVALYTSLLPMWRHVFPYMKQYFLIGCIFISCTALAPILWHLWIYASSANANFYFGITLAFNTGQIFMITDLLFAHVKRRYYLENGDPKELEAKNKRLELH